jgi:O-antigen/teichoic acid export membrane protein
LSAIVGVLANFLLIDLWGIYGAALATLLGAITFLVAWFLASQKLYPLPIRWTPLLAAVGAATVLAVLRTRVPSAGPLVDGILDLLIVLAALALCVGIGLVPLKQLWRALRPASYGAE